MSARQHSTTTETVTPTPYDGHCPLGLPRLPAGTVFAPTRRCLSGGIAYVRTPEDDRPISIDPFLRHKNGIAVRTLDGRFSRMLFGTRGIMPNHVINNIESRGGWTVLGEVKP